MTLDELLDERARLFSLLLDKKLSYIAFKEKYNVVEGKINALYNTHLKQLQIPHSHYENVQRY